ncbi:Centromere/kinetochore Zw10-domain-containing protein [Kickxella alabastrina]|uniref:Centromere/kinetochore Zw10-domain-containing protein n=1 Tax=Kickxella alabastrina TaxID=61397 RepID=UPI0022207005|nr:Centromere/kinetochore Zw10-domain-containing protein [Kickxella alabastrina]KAI7826691.1 Centromere/kinetochore Zw10-domain-containing protein [Kickxella alabastrina]
MGRRYRRDTRHADTELSTLTGEAQVSALDALISDISPHNHTLSAQIYGADPLDAVATVSDKYEIVRQAQPENPRLDPLGNTLNAVMRLAKAHANLHEIDEQLQHGDVAVAASSVAETAGLLGELEGDRAITSEYVVLMHSQLLRKRAAVRAELEYVHAMYGVAVSSDGAPYENAVTPSELLFALAELGLARGRMDRMADDLVTHCLVPLMRRPHEPLAVAHSPMGATLSIGAFAPPADASNSNNGGGGSGGGVHCELVRDKWAKVLWFVRSDVFHDVDVDEDLADLYAYLGSRMWRVVCPLVRSELLMPLVPACAEELADCGAMGPLLQLEDAWLEMRLITQNDLRIKAAVRDVVLAHVAKRRRDLLATVAAVLASNDDNTVVVGGSSDRKGLVGDSDRLAFPQCAISERAQTLVDFVNETMALTAADSEETPPLAALYFHAVRDALILHRALSRPAANGDDLKRAFVQFNDCEFISHNLATLGLRHRGRWPPVLKASATFTDAISAYRELGRLAMAPVLERLREQLSLALGSWQGQGASAEGALALACAVVERVCSVGSLYLSAEMFLRVLGVLVAPLAVFVAAWLEGIGAVGDVEARAVLRLVAPVVGLRDRFRYTAAGVAEDGVGFAQGHWDPLMVQIDRLTALSSKIATNSI